MKILESIPLIKRERIAVKTIAEVLRKKFPVPVSCLCNSVWFGFLEIVYHKAMLIEVAKHGLKVESETGF
jgi:hypothetical protein